MVRELPPQDPFWEVYYRRFLQATGDPARAADLLQQLRTKVACQTSTKPALTPTHALVSLVYSWVLADWLREKYRRTQHEARTDHEVDAPTSAPNAEEALADAEWRRAVRVALLSYTVTPLQRAVLENWDESPQELARQLGRTPEVVRNCRLRLRDRLRRSPVLRQLLLLVLS